MANYPYPQAYYPTSQPAPSDIPASVRAAAKRCGATHLSADGERIYKTLYGKLLQARFDGREAKSWWPCDAMPEGAVEVGDG